MNDLFKLAVVALIAGLIGGFVGGLVGNYQSDNLGAGTRFPSGISADTTSPVAGEVRGTTLAITATSSLAGALRYKEATEATTTDRTLTIAESGTTFYMGTAGLDIALPAIPGPTTVGVWYRFVVSANFSSTDMTVHGGQSDSSDDQIEGSITVAGAVVLCDSEDTITFANGAEIEGDWIELRSDGVNWYISGQASSTGGITCTDAD